MLSWRHDSPVFADIDPFVKSLPGPQSGYRKFFNFKLLWYVSLRAFRTRAIMRTVHGHPKL